MITLAEQCLLDYNGLFLIIVALGWLGRLANDTTGSSTTEQIPEYTLYKDYVKRCFDVVLSGLGLIILSPLFLIITILSKILIRGKVIYAQQRPGKNGKIFKLYKFRSMNDKRGPSGALLPDAERMTKFGKILRRLSLDELPQLVNILRGDMSIVGPRPRLVSDMIFYAEDVFPGYSVRPGLTGLDQVSGGRSDSSWETIFQKNLEYQQQVTFWGDVKIILLTVLEVFKKNNAANGAEAAQRDYYYDVYLLRTKQISQKQYDLGHARAAQLIAEKGVVKYQPDLQPVNKVSNKVDSNTVGDEK
ncbi:MAG: sugar transferase [Clostridia bacterium]|nr:sugar transferase [Clostridia bacterium]